MKARGLALLLAIQSACALPPYAPSPEVRTLLANGPVVAGATPPEIELEGFSRGRLDAVGDGANSTFAACVGFFGDGTLGEPRVLAAALILVLATCGASSVVGGAIGAASAPDAETVREAEGKLLAALAGNPMQVALREAVLASARGVGVELSSTAREPEGARLEVELTRVGTSGVGVDSPLVLLMTARARIVRARDGAELYSADYHYVGEKRTLREWSAENGAPLLAALENGYGSLGSKIFENVFALCLFPYRDRELRPSSPLETDFAFGLAALSPKTVGLLAGSTSPVEWEVVESLRPTLRWQSFPRASDSALDPDELARVSNVRYDLRVARGYEQAPVEVVYQRDSLLAPEHELEEPLQQATDYFWTVRARFELDGCTRLTEWSALGTPYEEQVRPLSKNSFRFRTPVGTR